jgi:phosphate butyryltransferase
MALDGFDRLYHDADARTKLARVSVAGGDDPTVLEAMRIACDCGWVQPVLFGPEQVIKAVAESHEIDLDEFDIRHAEGTEVAAAAVAEVRSGGAQALMKGQLSTPELMKAVLDHDKGLRTGRVICQVVLMEIPRDHRRFLLADTGICVQPSVEERIDILRSTVELAKALRETTPRVALMAASEIVKLSMPETAEAFELARRNQQGEFGDCLIEGPLSSNLLSANLTVKAIMYTADCRFGGVLRGTSAPVVFMSRADTTETRLNSLALTLRILDH